MELCGLLRQQLDMCSARRQTGDGKSFRMTRDDVKSLGADGSGGSENDDSGVGGYAHCSFFVSSLFSVGERQVGDIRIEVTAKREQQRERIAGIVLIL